MSEECFTKNDMENALHGLGLSYSQIEQVLAIMLNRMACALKEGKTVKTDIGSFKVVERAARKCRNPQTGEEISVPARKAVKYVPSKKLKDRLAD